MYSAKISNCAFCTLLTKSVQVIVHFTGKVHSKMHNVHPDIRKSKFNTFFKNLKIIQHSLQSVIQRVQFKSSKYDERKNH